MSEAYDTLVDVRELLMQGNAEGALRRVNLYFLEEYEMGGGYRRRPGIRPKGRRA